MSLRKKKSEIERLIKSFEQEADKFHEITFKLFYVDEEEPEELDEIIQPNHVIMLWQYWGTLSKDVDLKSLDQDLKDSNLKWGVRGAKLSCFGVLEGDTCKLFVRMAQRASSLFNQNESMLIKSRVIEEIRKSEMAENIKPVSAVNLNGLAIWLNYLLYYISVVAPGNENSRIIEPDPFSLSLLALEHLLVNPVIGKVDRSDKRVETIHFRLALSFPGERRSFVSKVTDYLRKELEPDEVFYDFDYQSQLARPRLDLLLRNIYKNNSELIVVFLSQEYAEKKWCGLEWEAIREILDSKESERIMYLRFDDVDIDGLLAVDGYIDASKYSEYEIANFILERLRLSN